MGLYISGLVVTVGLLIHVIYLKACYFKHEAYCLEYTTYEKLFISFPLYEYELIESGKTVVYQNRGETEAFDNEWIDFYPRKGKCCKILIKKNNHSKVVGYAKYIVHLVVGSILTVVLVLGIMI